MRQLTIAAVAVATVALVSAAPAVAEHLGGGATKQNGQCWKSPKAGAGPGSDMRWGTWGACAEPAGTAATRTTPRRRT
jgi:hypothetical protein